MAWKWAWSSQWCRNQGNNTARPAYTILPGRFARTPWFWLTLALPAQPSFCKESHLNITCASCVSCKCFAGETRAFLDWNFRWKIFFRSGILDGVYLRFSEIRTECVLFELWKQNGQATLELNCGLKVQSEISHSLEPRRWDKRRKFWQSKTVCFWEFRL